MIRLFRLLESGRYCFFVFCGEWLPRAMAASYNDEEPNIAGLMDELRAAIFADIVCYYCSISYFLLLLIDIDCF